MSYRASEHSVKYVVFTIPRSPSEMLMHTIEWLLIFNCYDSVLLLPKIWELVRFQQTLQDRFTCIQHRPNNLSAKTYHPSITARPHKHPPVFTNISLFERVECHLSQCHDVIYKVQLQCQAHDHTNIHIKINVIIVMMIIVFMIEDDQIHQSSSL